MKPSSSPHVPPASADGWAQLTTVWGSVGWTDFLLLSLTLPFLPLFFAILKFVTISQLLLIPSYSLGYPGIIFS